MKFYKNILHFWERERLIFLHTIPFPFTTGNGSSRISTYLLLEYMIVDLILTNDLMLINNNKKFATIIWFVTELL